MTLVGNDLTDCSLYVQSSAIVYPLAPYLWLERHLLSAAGTFYLFTKILQYLYPIMTINWWKLTSFR